MLIKSKIRFFTVKSFNQSLFTEMLKEKVADIYYLSAVNFIVDRYNHQYVIVNAIFADRNLSRGTLSYEFAYENDKNEEELSDSIHLKLREEYEQYLIENDLPQASTNLLNGS